MPERSLALAQGFETSCDSASSLLHSCMRAHFFSSYSKIMKRSRYSIEKLKKSRKTGRKAENYRLDGTIFEEAV